MSTFNHTIVTTFCPQCRSECMPEMIRCRQCGTLLHEQHAADDSHGSPQQAATHGQTCTCQNCGEEMRQGMLRCRSCGHVPNGAKPKPASVKLADSSAWLADLFNSVPLEEATPPSRPGKLTQNGAVNATQLEARRPLPANPLTVNTTISPPTVAKPHPQAPLKVRVCPDCHHQLEESARSCLHCAEVQVAYHVAFEQAKAQIAQTMVAQAEAAYKTAEGRAKAELAWAFGPNVDRSWWGWMGGTEFGPVEFMQVFALAKNGQLKPSDLIRNGSHGQFFPSSSAPGLLNAVTFMGKAQETLDLAKAQAQAATVQTAPPAKAPVNVVSKLAADVANQQSVRAAEAKNAATPPVAPSAASAPATPTGILSIPTPASTASASVPTPTSRESSSASSYSDPHRPTPAISSYSAARPHYSSRPQPKKQGWEPETAALFKKIMVGSLACVLVVGGFGLKHAFRKVHRTVVRSAPAANSVAGINPTKQNSRR